MLVALGGGVGTAVAIDGKIHRGARRGIEGGHAIVYPGGRKCACGQLGCLETYASGPSIARRADEILHEAPPGYEADGGWLTNGAMHPAVAGSKLARLSKIEARDVLEAAAAGDAVAARVVDEAADALALACLNYCRMVDPHVIAFAGGVATDELLRRVRARYDKLRWNILDDPVEIRLAAGGADK